VFFYLSLVGVSHFFSFIFFKCSGYEYVEGLKIIQIIPLTH